MSIARGIANCISRNEGTLVRYEDLKANPLETMNRVCEVLQISVPAVENIKQIAGDVRHPMNTTHVHKRLMNEFLGEPGVRELLDVYQSFGYNPSP